MRVYSGLIFLLLMTFGALIAYSVSEYTFSIGEIEIKKISLKSGNTDYEDTHQLDSAFQKADTIQFNMVDSIEHPEFVRDTNKQRILLIGDSMLEGLRLRMKDYAAFNEHYVKTVIWYSSSSKVYGSTDTLLHFIKQSKPSFIIISLGSNELFIRNIKEKRQKYIEKIISDIDSIPFVWIGPPNWKDDTGINELILENIGEGRYFPSYKLNFRRASDGVHPTHSSASDWLDSVALWMNNESSYRIKMEKPDKKYKRYSVNVTLLSSVD